jgi:hypothetical protein
MQLTDFETALNEIISEGLRKTIIDLTADFVASINKRHSLDVIMGRTIWGPSVLFQRLVSGLTESDPILHVATTNYDLMAEYSFEHQGISYTTGFCGGICRRRNWEQSERSFTRTEKRIYIKRTKPIAKVDKHIRLYKVHGSLNTFIKDDEIIENDEWIMDAPHEYERLLITPGSMKYEELHKNRNELLGEYDKAIERHNAFLFLGYGFNDNQLSNHSVREKLRNQNCHGLIITRDINSRILDLIDCCPNLWAVGAQEDTDNSLIINTNYSNVLIVEDLDLWNFNCFCNKILGG